MINAPFVTACIHNSCFIEGLCNLQAKYKSHSGFDHCFNEGLHHFQATTTDLQSESQSIVLVHGENEKFL